VRYNSKKIYMFITWRLILEVRL